MTFSLTRMLLGGALLAFSATGANATILNTAGQNLFAAGNSINGVFLHENAGDTSQLFLSINGGANIFLFQNNSGPQDGATVNIPTSPGASLVFTLHDLSTPNDFSTGAASTNVSYTIFDGNIANLNNALFSGGEVLSALAVTAINALGAGALVLAYEDRPLASSDKDYNDLVFAFRPLIACVPNQLCGTPRDNLPEPGVIGLLAVGLLSLFGLSRRRRRLFS